MRLRRALLVVVALGALASAGASGVAADEPDDGSTLGVSIESRVYADEDRMLGVRNESTMDVVVTFEPTGGWQVEPTELTLAPGAEGAVEVIGFGEDAAPTAITVASVDSVEAAEPIELALESLLYTERPFDPWPIVWLVGVGSLIVLLVAGAATWRWLRDRRRSTTDERERWLARIA